MMALFTLQRQWIEQFTVWAESRDDVRADWGGVQIREKVKPVRVWVVVGKR
jgi:hypothetical protein